MEYFEEEARLKKFKRQPFSWSLAAKKLSAIIDKEDVEEDNILYDVSYQPMRFPPGSKPPTRD